MGGSRTAPVNKGAAVRRPRVGLQLLTGSAELCSRDSGRARGNGVELRQGGVGEGGIGKRFPTRRGWAQKRVTASQKRALLAKGTDYFLSSRQYDLRVAELSNPACSPCFCRARM